MKKIKVSVVGSTGYAGQELLRILSAHQGVEVVSLSSQSYVGKKYSDVFSNFKGIYDQECVAQNMLEFAKESDVVFLALPHGIATKEVTQDVLNQGCKIIDLGADFRLQDVAVYEQFYGVPHLAKDLLKQAVYGLPELNRDKIKTAQLVANPGCYATCSILSLAPFLKAKCANPDCVIIDAKSGVSGAGRTLDIGSLFCEVNENIKAYKIASHRHTPEIEQVLRPYGGNNVTFTPHLIPMNRGILVTCYLKATQNVSVQELKQSVQEFYQNEPFVRVLEGTLSVQTRDVKGSNLFDINVYKDDHTNQIIVTGVLDNLVKGASGQAIQNMNLMTGFEETMGLKNLGMLL